MKVLVPNVPPDPLSPLPPLGHYVISPSQRLEDQRSRPPNLLYTEKAETLLSTL